MIKALKQTCNNCLFLKDYCVLLGVPADKSSVDCPSKKPRAKVRNSFKLGSLIKNTNRK